MQMFILSHGLNFSLPPKAIDRQAVFAEFEVLMTQLQHQESVSPTKKQELHARLIDIAHSYCGTPISSPDWRMLRKCREALGDLKAEESIVILKPDKGSGVVVMDRIEYNMKMTTILNDTTKFERLGPVERHDNTAKVEMDLRGFLVTLVKNKQLPKDVQDDVRPVGSQRPRLYGLPKTHKLGTPLRPILSMTGSVQHKLARWLTRLIQPVLEFYSTHCLKDSFTFAETMRETAVDSECLMCSFDVSSLFTNVPLDETIQICADKLYADNMTPGGLSRENFIELMNYATGSVEFSFDDVMYRQIDGVAMGSPLGPSLANIFVGYQEQRLFSNIRSPRMYYRYVDDTFVIVRNRDEMETLFQQLNSLHPNLRFTNEVEVDNKLPFLDVMVERRDTTYTTSVYRKPTFTGQYVRWDSFCDKRRKVNLIKTLVHRAKRICSADTLCSELDLIKSILIDNGYPEGVISKVINIELSKPRNNTSDEQKSSATVYLRLPFIGPSSTIFKQRIVTAISRCYPTVSPRVILTSRPILSPARKDVLPTLNRSNLVYEFTCHCDSRYVGKTTQRLATRIKQHVPVYVRRNTRLHTTPDSAIGKHLRENDECRANYSDSRFKILCHGRSDFHLSVLEALHIMDRQPVLCVQKKFVYSTLLFSRRNFSS
jgi:hypothetical protein